MYADGRDHVVQVVKGGEIVERLVARRWAQKWRLVPMFVEEGLDVTDAAFEGP
jgi:hypothetical protein